MSVIPVDLAGVTRYVAGFSTMLGYWFEYPQSIQCPESPVIISECPESRPIFEPNGLPGSSNR